MTAPIVSIMTTKLKRFCTIFFIILIATATPAAAQNPADVNKLLCFAKVYDGDTIPYFDLKPLVVKEKWALLTSTEIRKNQRLIRNIKKTLPYAKEAKRRLQALDKELDGMNPKKRADYVKKVERELLSEFQEDLENLTISQGKVLLKLVDRETGNTSYALVTELRGKLRASFYQTFARVFGINLKARYDPKHNKDDALIEKIVRSIEMGKL